MTEKPIYVASAEHQIDVGGGGVKLVPPGFIVTVGGDEPGAYPLSNFGDAFPGFDPSLLLVSDHYDPEIGAPPVKPAK